MSKIVILDGYTENPGDLSWREFEELGDVIVYDRTEKKDILEKIKDAEIVLTNKTPITRETIEKCNKLKYIGVLATGYNVVDIKAAKERNIPVCNIPTYGTDSVAQMCFALILEFYNSVGIHNEAVKNKEWSNCKDFCFWKSNLIELSNKTIGFIGFGRIGQRAADIAQAFNMNVLAYDVYRSNQDNRKNFKYVSLDELIEKSDIISLHCNLTEENYHMINKDTISKMKKNALIINTSRGPLINEEDLLEALNNHQIAGACLDVLEVEPPKEDNPLLKAKNIIITPHISWATFEARKRLMDIAVNNLKSFLNGKEVNRVNS